MINNYEYKLNDLNKRIEALPDINYSNWKNQIKGYAATMRFIGMPERYLNFVINNVNRSTHLFDLMTKTDLGKLWDEYHEETFLDDDKLRGHCFEMREITEIPSINWVKDLEDVDSCIWFYIDMDKILIFTHILDLENNKPVWSYDF